MRSCLIALGLFVFLVMHGGPVWSQSEKGVLTFMQGPGEPTDTIHISSAKGRGRRLPNGYEATFSGKVKVQQGDMTLTCDRLVIIYEQKKKPRDRKGNPKAPADLQDASNIKSITAIGHVKIVQQQTRATAGKAVYDAAKRTITLTENPRLRRGRNVLQAATIIIYLDENRTEFDGGGEGIRGTLNPTSPKK